MEAYKKKLNDNNEIKISHKYLATQATLKKRGNIVTLTYPGDWKSGTPTGNLGTIYTLPDGFAPPEACVVMTLPALEILITVRSNGEVTGWNYSNALSIATSGRFTVTWVV